MAAQDTVRDPASDTRPEVDPDDRQLLTIDELALTTGMTVRTTRYYASLGLLPAPLRRGRVAYYGPSHLARLELIRALQDHGFTLAAIERYLAHVPMDATPEELAVQRALLTAWKPGHWEPVSRAELDERAGRPLDEDDLDWLVRAGAVRREGTRLQALPLLRLAVELRDVGVPLEGITEANAAVRRHMSELADELADIMQERIVSRYRHADLSREDAEQFERTVDNLRTLTLDAIVNAFQRSANQLAIGSLGSGRSRPQ
jgi:DNA-binding transcriptional MerR regulator